MAVCLRALDRYACRISTHLRQSYQLGYAASGRSMSSNVCSNSHQPHTRNWISSLTIDYICTNISSVKNISTSSVLLKKFREEKYEKLRIYDPNGNFLCVHELLILEKFCHHYHKYSFVEMDVQEEKNTKQPSGGGEVTGDVGDDEGSSLRAFQLVKKPTKQKKGQNEKVEKMKELKFSSKTDGLGWKLDKLKQILLDKEVVHIIIEGRKDSTQLVKRIEEGISGISEVKEMSRSDTRVTFTATLLELDTNAYQGLLNDLYVPEASKLNIVQELIKEKHKQDS